MNKTTASINFSPSALNILDDESASLGLSRSSYIESLIVTKTYLDGYHPTQDELDSLNDGFLMNSSSSISCDFRNQHKHLTPQARFAAIAFFYGLNLIGGVSVSSIKQANFSKNHNLMCYYAAGLIGRGPQLVHDYVYSLSNIPFIFGPSGCAKNEYIFISNLQQFKIPKLYVHFTNLCHPLGAPFNTKVIQVHYSKLQDLLSAIATV